MRLVWPSLAVLAAALAAVSCTRDNAAYCDDTKPCPTGTCDLMAKRCVASVPDLGGADAPVGVDLAGADLNLTCGACSGTTPICKGGVCVGCTGPGGGEAGCTTLSPATPHCLTSGAASGSCVGCRDSTDCIDSSKPSCDATTHACRACAADAECPSEVCDLTPGSPTLGRCVSNVIYVDGGPNGNDGNDGSMQKPVATISTGVMKAMQASASVVRIAAVAGGYYGAENLSLNNAVVTLVGETGAAIRPKGTNNAAFVTMGSSGKVVVRNLIFTQGAGTMGNGILCSGGTLTVLTCSIHSNAQFGIDANMCGSLVVDRSLIGPPSATTTGNQQGAMRVGASTSFRITNNFVVRNGNNVGNSGGGVVINTMTGVTPHDLVANTIANNVGSGLNAGASCNGGTDVVATNNIFWGNLYGATGSESNCTQTYSCTDDATQAAGGNNQVLIGGATPAFAGTTDYHLTMSSLCRQKGAPSGLPSVDIDGQPRPDSTTGKSDIGADEYYP